MRVGIRTVAVAAIAAMLLAAEAGPAAAGAGDPLAVTSTGLTDGQYIGDRLTIYPTWTGDVSKVEVYENDRVVRTLTGAARAVQVPTFGVLADGSDVDITVRVYDADGNTAAATTAVHVDVVLPHATFDPALTDLRAVRGVVPVTAAEVSDDVVKMALTDELTGTDIVSTTAAPWTLEWDTVAHPRLVEVRLTDRGGNVMTYAPHWQTDNAPPVIGDLENYDATAVASRVHGWTQLDVHISDSSGINHSQWWLDGVLVSEFEMKPPTYTDGAMLTYDFGTVEGVRQLELRVWDRAGNESARTFPIVVDGTGPAITSATPADGALVRGSEITGTVRATDPSGVPYAELNHVYTDSSTHFTASTPAGGDGRHTVTWQVNDGVGNTSTLARTVTVDNTRPSLKITKAPKNKVKVHGTIKVYASASDRNGVNRVELLINGKVVATDSRAGYSFSINSKKHGKKFKVQLRAYDRAGNSTISAARTWHR